MSHLFWGQRFAEFFTMLRGRHNDDRVIDLQPLFDEAGHRCRQKRAVVVRLYGMALETYVL